MTRQDKRDQSPSLPPHARGNVDLNLLNVFDVVMTERHVTRAAERLEMTQSAVSNALNRLRLQFQDQLFVKAARGVNPTPRAIAIWPSVHRALQELRSSVQPQFFDAANAVQTFRIAMADITVALLAPTLYSSVQAAAPHIKLFFVPHDPVLAAPRLMRGEVDFAISIEPPRTTVVQTMPLWSDSFVIAARQGHPLLQSTISLETFCRAPQIAINESGDEEVPNIIDETLANLGQQRNISLSVNQFSVVTKILSDTDLIAALPARFATAPASRGSIGTQPLPIAIPEVVVYMSWHRRSNTLPTHQWLKERIIQASARFNTETAPRVQRG
ncbi:LysR family transcriptional regulator [Noviherbaspirillum saxi]|uniref:LysR family transcriptional regulator n=1 Tax=Noviherbaspirillum saxi TaxID=2320863 RepID=UPI001314C3BA|nr:LysR family transcriptional regulator [Noviherbaspirillum saxi]